MDRTDFEAERRMLTREEATERFFAQLEKEDDWNELPGGTR